MSDLKAWRGTLGGREAVLVARTGSEAARLAGIKPADLPFRFERTTRPHGADRPGVYRHACAGVYVRELPARPPPDLEEP